MKNDLGLVTLGGESYKTPVLTQQKQGSIPSPVFVLVPGAETGRTFDPVVEQLHDLRYSTIVLNSGFGYGVSYLKTFSRTDNLDRMLDELLSFLPQKARIIFIGQSYGCPLSVNIANKIQDEVNIAGMLWLNPCFALKGLFPSILTWPIPLAIDLAKRSNIVTSFFTENSGVIKNLITCLVKCRFPGGIPLTFYLKRAKVREKRFGLTEHDLLRSHVLCRVWPPQLIAELYADIASAMYKLDDSHLPCTVRILWGEHDVLVRPLRNLPKRLGSNFQEQTTTNAGHFLSRIKPQLVVKEVLKFI